MARCHSTQPCNLQLSVNPIEYHFGEAKCDYPYSKPIVRTMTIKPPSDYSPPRTDPLGWRLIIGEDSHGQQKWTYLPPGPARDEWKQCKVAKYALGLEVGAPKFKKAKTPMEAARNGFGFYKQLQSSDGHFATEYGGGELLAR